MKIRAYRLFPNGKSYEMQPYHVCMKGLENVVLFRDEDDYDAMVKIICVCALRKKVRVIIYAVVSNHCHVAILARSPEEAEAFAQEIKRVYSMWFSRKYRERGILHREEIKAIPMETEWHVRNTLAYIPRNALDNQCPIHLYPWSGYRAMFCGKQTDQPYRPVAALTFRERVAIMHTGDKLTDVPWLLDSEEHLIPSSFCDCEYLEQAFAHDAAFFLKTIGELNPSQMHHLLEEMPYQMQSDSDYYKTAGEIAARWFKTEISQLSLNQQTRLVPYLYRSTKTSISQLARVMGVPRERIAQILQINSYLCREK